MKIKKIVALAFILTLIAMPIMAVQPVISTESVNVMDYGAKGDGIADDTSAFKKAIEESQNLSVPVFVPGGSYLITSTLTLTGQDFIGYPASSWTADYDSLPEIIINHKDGPAILLNGGTVSGFRIKYNQMASTYLSYPETISISTNDCKVINTKIIDATTGIKIDGSNLRNILIENVFMPNAHKEGITINGSSGAVIRNVEVWTPDPNSPFIGSGIGLHMLANEDLLVTDTFIFNAAKSFFFEDSNNAGTTATMLNCMVDMGGYGIEVSGKANLTLRGSNFFCHSEALRINTGSKSVVKAYANSFNCNGSYVIDIRGGITTSIVGSTMKRGMDERNVPVILAGSTGIFIQGSTVIGNMAKNSTSPVVQWTSAAKDFVFKNNIVNYNNNANAFSGTLSTVVDNVTVNRDNALINE